jgi:protein involved in polysaccharide export with SLBB domain
MSKIQSGKLGQMLYGGAMGLALIITAQAQQRNEHAANRAQKPKPTVMVIERAPQKFDSSVNTNAATVDLISEAKSEIETAADDSKKHANDTAAANADAAHHSVEASVKTATTARTVNASETYRVGSGDVLDIRILNLPTARASTLYTVLAGGLLEFPLIGAEPINVNNLTVDEIAARLASILKQNGALTDAQIIVNVRDYASHQVVVNGLVEAPGAHILRREAEPLYVIVAESLPKRNAGRITLIARATNERRTIDLDDAAAMNTLVRAGDVISVEERPREFFYIAGQVANPGQKDFHQGLTLTQALLTAGGAARGVAVARIARQTNDERLTFVEYNLKEIETGRAPDPRIQAGDRIEVGKK